ncbi:MAG: conjugal transfer protein TraG N-terminal domain-containing protein [Pseudomonadota bacterium]
MPELEIHTVGGGYYLFTIFNYLAAFASSQNFSTLMYAGLTAGVLMAAFQMAVFGSVRQGLLYAVGAILAVSIGIGPKARVIVLDSTVPLGIYGIVDNVPWSVAWVGSLTSRTSDALTSTMETLLAAPTDLTYQSSGMLFGASILSQSTRWRAVTPVVQESLVNFMENCMVDGANIGLVDKGDMGHAGDLTNFITSNVPASLAYYDPVLNATTLCATGWPDVQTRLANEVNNILFQKASAKYAGIPLLSLPAAANKMGNTLGQFQNFIGNTSATAATSIQQSMLVIAMDDSVQRLIASSGNNAAMTAYQAARTEAQTSASYSAIGISALKWVPLLKIVFESLYYAAFPIAMLLMMTPLVWTVAKGYFGGFVWLAAWDPLSAILHSVVMWASSGYYREAMGQFDGATIDYVMSFSNYLGVRAVEQEVGTVAGYLMMSVPFIATAIFFGARGVAGLATSMLNVSQGAAIESGREAATGNISLANASMNNFAANKWNTSHLFDEGVSTRRMGSGAFVNVNPDGSSTFSTGTAQSSSGMSARVGQSIREELSDRTEASIRTSNSKRDEWSSAVSELAANYADFGRSLSNGTSAYNDQTTSGGYREVRDAREAHSAVESFAKDHGISTNAAYTIALTAGTPGQKILGAKASAEAIGLDQDTYRNALSAAQESGLSSTVSKFGDATRSIRASSQSSLANSENSGERWSIDEVKRKGQTYAEAYEESQNLASANAKLQSQGISYDGQLTDAIVNEWRQESYSDQQIESFLNPKSTQGVKRQEAAVEQVLPSLLDELKLTRPNDQISGAFSLSPPKEEITEQRLPSSGTQHTQTVERYEDANDKARANADTNLTRRADSTTNKAAANQSQVVEGQDLGVVPGTVKKAGTTALDVVDSAADAGRGLVGWVSGERQLSPYERDVMIRTIAGEAGRESELGQAAVAHVILNRSDDPRWGDDPAEVSLQLKQFSAWNSGVGGNGIPEKIEEGSPAYERIGRIVDAVAAGEIADPTGGATHYFSPKGMDAHVAAGEQSNRVPTWLASQSQARGGQNVEIGGHVFTGRKRGDQ